MLRELQQQFAHAVLTQQPEQLGAWVTDSTPAACLALYANTFRRTLTEALHAIYPVLHRLVGQRCFAGLANLYVDRHTSFSGDLHDYGAGFGALLAQLPNLAAYPYLPDIAQLEWHMHRVFHAATTVPLNTQRLQMIPPEQFDHLCFELAPTCVLLHSAYPVHRIWEVNQPQHDGTLCIQPQHTCLLLRRPQHQVELVPLCAAAYALLQAIANGSSITTAFELALAVEPSCNPGNFLTQHIMARDIFDFYSYKELS